MNLYLDREFDADKHCGVWIAELERKCTRSLTCKVCSLLPKLPSQLLLHEPKVFKIIYLAMMNKITEMF